MADKFTLVATLPATGCTREDIYDLIRTAVPTVDLVDEETAGVTGGKVYVKSWVPRWRKFSFTYENFTAAGLTESIAAFALAAGGVIHKAVLDVTEAWVISGMSTLDLELGIAGTAGKYSNSSHTDGEALGADIYAPGATDGLESMSASTNILLTATSDAGNLNTATAGAVDVYVLYSNLINA